MSQPEGGRGPSGRGASGPQPGGARLRSERDDARWSRRLSKSCSCEVSRSRPLAFGTVRTRSALGVRCGFQVHVHRPSDPWRQCPSRRPPACPEAARTPHSHRAFGRRPARDATASPAPTASATADETSGERRNHRGSEPEGAPGARRLGRHVSRLRIRAPKKRDARELEVSS
jgi:hypothetical protein